MAGLATGLGRVSTDGTVAGSQFHFFISLFSSDAGFEGRFVTRESSDSPGGFFAYLKLNLSS